MRRVSFTLFCALFFLVMFASVAFAVAPAAPTNLVAEVGDKQVTITWNTVTDAVKYYIYVDGVKEITEPTALTFTKTGLTNGTSYKFEVAAVNVTDEVSAKTPVTTPGIVAQNSLMSSGDSMDGGVDFNANQTGSGVTTNDGTAVGEVLKSDGMTNQNGTTGSQRTHGEYQNNTNSCASCHQTHTAASKSLLFKDGTYNTCTACHDGTLGFYNVFDSSDPDMLSAGTFGGSHVGNMSVHLASGSVNMSAAPGGYIGADRGGKWTSEFNCASCHAPHGSYSDRLLHYNPNGMAATKPEDGGIKADKVAVLNYVDRATGTTKYIAVRGTRAEHGLTDDTKYGFIGTDRVIMIYEKIGTSYVKTTNPWMYGYPQRGATGYNHFYYTRFFTADPATILETNGTYSTTKASQVVDHYDYLADTAHIKYAKGMLYADATTLDALIYAEVSRAYVVKLDLMPILDPAKDDGDLILEPGEERTFGTVKITTVNQRALYAGETNPLSVNIADRWGVATPGTTKVSGWGIAMSQFCSACHADYLATSSQQTKVNGGTGIFSKGFRHTTTSDSYTCVRCHFAHGTDVELMRDAHNRTIEQVVTQAGVTEEQATEYMLDKNPSSALKRFTNMAVCWSCHTSSKAEQLKNNDSYNYDGTSQQDPRGITTTEGKQNWPKIN